ncbi:MAG: hypothetical protein ABJA83_03755 [Burkholderiaceae bacterium]
MTATTTRPGHHPTESPLRIPPVNTPEHDERLLDQAIAESFPASDPISPAYDGGREPVLFEQSRSREVWKRRLRKAAPSLIALGSAALVALVAVYVLRERRSSLPDWRDWRDYIPWRQ